MNRNKLREKSFHACTHLNNWDNYDKSRRIKYIMDYPDKTKEPFPSQGDFLAIIPLLLMTDEEIDNYSIGIYCRLYLLKHFQHKLNEIYNYGQKEYIDKALEKLKRLEYIDENLNIIY